MNEYLCENMALEQSVIKLVDNLDKTQPKVKQIYS